MTHEDYMPLCLDVAATDERMGEVLARIGSKAEALRKTSAALDAYQQYGPGGAYLDAARIDELFLDCYHIAKGGHAPDDRQLELLRGAEDVRVSCDRDAVGVEG